MQLTFQRDDDVRQAGVDVLGAGVPLDPGAEDLGQHPRRLPPLLLPPPDVRQGPDHHPAPLELAEPGETMI